MENILLFGGGLHLNYCIEDLDELNDIINYREAILNFVQFENKKLFFGFSYILSFSEQFIEEFERILLITVNRYLFNC